MGWGAAIGAGLGLLGANQQRQGANANARQIQQGVNYAQGMYRDAQGNLSPYMQSGLGALGQWDALNHGNLTDFYNASPDYKIAREAMQYAGDSGAAARGNVFSGGHQVDMAQKQGDLATAYLGNFRNSLMGMSQLGQQSAMGLGQLGAQSANTVMNGYAGIGQAQQDAHGAIAGGLAGLGNAFGRSFGSNFGGGSVYGGGANASNFGLPAPVDPYANTNYGQSGWHW